MAKMKQTLEIDFEYDGHDIEINYRLNPKRDDIAPDNVVAQEVHLLALTACNEVYQYMKRNIK